MSLLPKNTPKVLQSFTIVVRLDSVNYSWLFIRVLIDSSLLKASPKQRRTLDLFQL